MQALSLGGTRTLPELYDAAGLKFNFAKEQIKQLMDLLVRKWKKLPKIKFYKILVK